jgi:hypothetical protein
VIRTLQQNLKASQETVEVESLRGNTYKKVYDESQAYLLLLGDMTLRSQDLTSRLGAERLRREELERLNAQLLHRLEQADGLAGQAEGDNLKIDARDGCQTPTAIMPSENSPRGCGSLEAPSQS